ncbi:kinase-like domain-containing protein [Mycena crocata]|nr:kinase-like domain-containing protein [Mycena crocata]
MNTLTSVFDYSMSARYQEHIQRHDLTILDGRVALKDAPAITNGNYGDVYMGNMNPLQPGSRAELVAVKMIRGRSMDDSEIRKFLREIHTWSKLDSTNNHILPLLGITLDLGGTLSIISPWMENGSARKYVLNEAIHPVPLLYDIATALHYLHTRKDTVYHGDLKGENVLVSDSGRAFLADFGFSVLVSSSFSLPISSPTGGTPLWMAPEKLSGEGDDSVASDVYSFGMLILELFTRNDPFAGEPRPYGREVQKGRRPRRPSPLMTLNRLTDEWWNLCESCWAPDPSKRWTTEQVREAIGCTKFQNNDCNIKLNMQIEGGSTTTASTDGPIKLTFIRDGRGDYHYESQVLLTLIPAELVPNHSTPIVWKILTFDDDLVERTLTWTREFGFCTIHQQEDGTIVPESTSVLQLGQMSRLLPVAGKLHWSVPMEGNDRYQVAASNQSHIPSALALCICYNGSLQFDPHHTSVAVDSGGRYSPVLHLGHLLPNSNVSCGEPVKLQAYAVSGNKAYEEGQLIEGEDLDLPLIVNSEALPESYDFRNHPSKQVKFIVSNNPSGRLILKSIQV